MLMYSSPTYTCDQVIKDVNFIIISFIGALGVAYSYCITQLLFVLH